MPRCRISSAESGVSCIKCHSAATIAVSSVASSGPGWRRLCESGIEESIGSAAVREAFLNLSRFPRLYRGGWYDTSGMPRGIDIRSGRHDKAKLPEAEILPLMRECDDDDHHLALPDDDSNVLR